MKKPRRGQFVADVINKFFKELYYIINALDNKLKEKNYTSIRSIYEYECTNICINRGSHVVLPCVAIFQQCLSI